jgi:hypothetical protein
MFNEIKAGNEVEVVHPGFNTFTEKAKVARVTATQIVLENGKKFRKVDGQPVARGFGEMVYIRQIAK